MSALLALILGGVALSEGSVLRKFDLLLSSLKRPVGVNGVDAGEESLSAGL